MKWDAREVAFQPGTDRGDLESCLTVVKAPPASSGTSGVKAVEAFEMRSSHWSPQGGALIISSSRAGGFNLDNYRVKWLPLYSAVRWPISPLTSEVAAAASRLNRHVAGSLSYCR